MALRGQCSRYAKEGHCHLVASFLEFSEDSACILGRICNDAHTGRCHGTFLASSNGVRSLQRSLCNRYLPSWRVSAKLWRARISTPRMRSSTSPGRWVKCSRKVPFPILMGTVYLVSTLTVCPFAKRTSLLFSLSGFSLACWHLLAIWSPMQDITAPVSMRAVYFRLNM